MKTSEKQSGTSSEKSSGLLNVLDHGYVELIETWGSEERIIEAARMSTGKGFKGWKTVCSTCDGSGLDPIKNEDGDYVQYACKACSGSGEILGDEKLLRYLYTHKHATPFEMAGLIIEVQAPIMVFREWHRHRTQSYNEMSGRYTELPDLCYVPSIDRLMSGKQSSKNKQSSEAGFTDQQAIRFAASMQAIYDSQRLAYEQYLQLGLSKELARLILPVSQYSRMRASANLRNWLAFLTLRLAPNAQWEIRQYAKAVSTLIKQAFPRTHALFEEGSTL